MRASFKRAKFSAIFLILLPSIALIVLFLYQDYTSTLYETHKLISQFPITPEMAASLHNLIDPLNRLSIKIIILLLVILILGYIRLFYIFRQRDESFLDPATKVFNRRYYHEVMKTLDRNHYQILLLHIDNFDDLHTRYDQEITDIMMKSIANRILRIIRNHDIFIRFEEASFIIFFKTKRNEKADILAQRVIDTIKEPIIAEGLFITVNLCIAINSNPERSDSLQEAINLAKSELHTIERNSFKSSHHENYNSSKKSRAIFELHEALKNKTVVPMYQPIYDTKTMATNRYELFARIRSSETTFVKAKSFIDLVSNDAVSSELDKTMLTFAVTLLRKQPVHAHLNIHVNTLFDASFIAAVKEQLPNDSAMASRLAIEINGLGHDNVTKHKEHIKQHIEQFKSLHLTVVLDLQTNNDVAFNDILFLNPDILKLSADIANEESQTLISLCKEMNIPIILKKIQNEDEISFAKANRIDYMQGYFLNEPDFNIKEEH